MTTQPVLIAGRWREAHAAGTFQAENPRSAQPLADEYPISSWQDGDDALQAAHEAAAVLRKLPAERIAQFLESYANRIEQRKDELVAVAHLETGLGQIVTRVGCARRRKKRRLSQCSIESKPAVCSLPSRLRQE